MVRSTKLRNRKTGDSYSLPPPSYPDHALIFPHAFHSRVIPTESLEQALQQARSNHVMLTAFLALHIQQKSLIQCLTYL